MGNIKSNNKSIEKPPPYEEINHKQIIDDTIEKPITADEIIRERKTFKDKQIEVYETDFKSCQNLYIKSINENLSAAIL
jgi:hypothetical protein